MLARGRLIHAAPDPAPSRSSKEPASVFAESAAFAIKARAHDAEADEAALDRVVELARLLAERLLEKSLELSPSDITGIARAVLEEARSARRIELFVHPSHVSVLEGATDAFDPERRAHTVVGDSSLEPGDVKLVTELGVVEARIGSELTLLANRLRDALRS